jgi:hypothetical protein
MYEIDELSYGKNEKGEIYIEIVARDDTPASVISDGEKHYDV